MYELINALCNYRCMSECLHNLFIGYANLFISAQHAVKAPHHPLLSLSHSIGMQQFFFLTAAALSRLFRYLSTINFIPKQQRVTSVYYFQYSSKGFICNVHFTCLLSYRLDGDWGDTFFTAHRRRACNYICSQFVAQMIKGNKSGNFLSTLIIILKFNLPSLLVSVPFQFSDHHHSSCGLIVTGEGRAGMRSGDVEICL